MTAVGVGEAVRDVDELETEPVRAANFSPGVDLAEIGFVVEVVLDRALSDHRRA